MLRAVGGSFAAATLCAAAALAPFANGRLIDVGPGLLTVGRLLVVLCALALVADLATRRVRLRGLPLTGRLLILAFAGFGIVAAASAGTRGCDCASSLSGYGELGVFLVVAVIVAGSRRQTLRPLLLSCLAGAWIGSIWALAGLGTVGPEATQVGGGRLAGTYGNPNHLGYLIALGSPVAVALLWPRDRRTAALFAIATLPLGIALLLSYSRGALIAGAVGVLATVAVAHIRTRQAALRFAVAIAAAAAIVALAYPLYLDARIERDRSDSDVALVARDRSGWDAGLGGLPAVEPARLSNAADGALRVTSTRSGQGVGFAIGDQTRGTRVVVIFDARSPGGPLPFAFGVKADFESGDAKSRTAVLDRTWRGYQVNWQAAARGPRTSAYFWQSGGASAFELRNVRVRVQEPGAPASTATQRAELIGSVLDTRAHREEDRYLESRLDAAGLALEAFADEPIVGIGWDRFPELAARELDYGELATHNEYLRIAAELGIPGLLMLGFAGYVLVLAMRRAGRSAIASAAIGVTVTAAVAQLFLNGVGVAEASVAAVIAAAILCAGLPAARREQPL